MVHPATVAPTGLAGLPALAVFTIAAAQVSLATQVGEQGDYPRLMPDPHHGTRRRWRLAVIMGGPGFALFAVGIAPLCWWATPPRRSARIRSACRWTCSPRWLIGNHTVALVLASCWCCCPSSRSTS
jgi:hypothetical protein